MKTIPASLNFCCKTYKKGQNTPILAIKSHNTDIFRINIMVSFWRGERDSKHIALLQSLYFKAFPSPVPSLPQGILFIKSVMFVRLYTAICRKAAVYGNNRSRYKAACLVVRKPHQSANKVGNFAKFPHGRRRKDFARSRRRRAVFVE